MRPRARRQAAFTLVELLVVIGIIAVLISILLPTLSKSRKQAYRVQCMSNQRQLMQAILMYAQSFKGSLPDSTQRGSYYGSNRVYNSAAEPARGAADGWIALGKLWYTRALPAGAAKAFYCPAVAAVSNAVSYDQEQWSPKNPPYQGIIYIGYMYRVFDDRFQTPNWMPAIERDHLMRLKLGKLRLPDGGVLGDGGSPVLRQGNGQLIGPIALTSDLMGNRGLGLPLANWAHDNPWGANVGYSDGHAEWIAVPKRLCILPQQWSGDPNPGTSDHFVGIMFKCYDRKDLSDANLVWP
jgi:prepilin-type N-terminal cleavage/methylation domain-containing protein